MKPIFNEGDIVILKAELENNKVGFGDWPKVYRKLGKLTVIGNVYTSSGIIARVKLSEKQREFILTNMKEEELSDDNSTIHQNYLDLVAKRKTLFSNFYEETYTEREQSYSK